MQCVLAPLFHTNDAGQICNRGRDAALRRPVGAARRPYRSQSAAREIQAHIPFREARHRTSPSEGGLSECGASPHRFSQWTKTADDRSRLRRHPLHRNLLYKNDEGAKVKKATRLRVAL